LPELEGDWRDEEDRSSIDGDSDLDVDEDDEHEDSEDEEEDGVHGVRSEVPDRFLRRRFREWL